MEWRAGPWPLVAAVIAMAGVLGYALTRPVAPPRVMRTVELTNTNRPKSGVVTDGARLYFIENLSILSQTSVTGGETFPIPTSLEDTGFANVFDISRDGSIAADEYGARHFARRPAVERTSAGRIATTTGDTRGACRSVVAGRKQIAYCKGNEIFLAKSDGGDPRRLLDAGGTPSDCVGRPTDRCLRFTLNDPKTNSRSIWQASADGGISMLCFPAGTIPPNECCGNWTPDGSIMFSRRLRDDTANIWAIHEHNGIFRSTEQEPMQLTTGPMNVGIPWQAAMGKNYLCRAGSRGEKWSAMTQNRGNLSPYLSGISAMGWISRDGEWVAYNDGSDGTMWRSKIDGSQKLQLVFPPMLAYLPRWSPDGKQIAFFGHPPGEPWQILYDCRGGWHA